MAGAKETPRQKMIGMMYLVLTAMLALNVDSAVLERFELINGTLENQISTNGKRNNSTIGNIAEAVKDKGNRPGDVKVLNKAKEVRSKTTEIVAYMDSIKAQIVTKTGGRDPETNMLVGAKDMDQIATMMIRNKKGIEVQSKLNDYTNWLSTFVGRKFDPIALDGKEDPYWSQIPNQRSKNFSELMFESVPTAGGLASLSQLEGVILDYEEIALGELSSQVGAGDISFQNIQPMLLPESQLVAAGAKYKAKMFVTATAVGAKPSMSYNGVKVPVDASGVGEFEFTAKADKYDKNGQQKKSINAVINLEGTQYKQTFEYVVARPVIQIQSASVQALYRNCGNKLDVQVPALGAAYNPSFRVKGGSSQGGKGGKVTIVPTSPKLDLSVYSAGTYIGKQSFRVKQIPKPELVLKSQVGELNLKNGIDKVPRRLTYQAVADPDFAQFLPDDAKYRVTKWEVILARGTRPLDTKRVNGPSADLSDWVSRARPGDRIVVEAKEVQRMNFKGQKETVKISPSTAVKSVTINK